MTSPQQPPRLRMVPRERLWLLCAQGLSALLSALGAFYVLARHPMIKASLPWFPSHGLLIVGSTSLAVLGLSRAWQAWEEARLRRQASVSEAAVGARTWRRAVGAVLLMQYLLGGTAIATVALGIPPELVFTSILFLLVAPVLTSSWIARQTQRQLARQRDLALQARMAPHFLYNSLSTLKGQIQEDPGEAMQTADRLAQLFRELMGHTAENTVPLGREVAWVEAYLGLEQARLGDRLQVQVDVPEELEAIPVPPLCLQVLVENAVKHGIAPRKEGGLLTIKAEGVRGGLRLSVTDPGDGTSSQRGTGQALTILRQRLTKPGDLQLGILPQGGHCASVTVCA